MNIRFLQSALQNGWERKSSIFELVEPWLLVYLARLPREPKVEVLCSGSVIFTILLRTALRLPLLAS